MTPNTKYLAFISYCHQDNEVEGCQWANWMKELIEGFEVPVNCLPAEGEPGAAADRLREVFLDRDRMTARDAVMKILAQNLEQSEFLVVLCSPRSEKSAYVLAEVAEFKRLGRADRIISVLVDGDHEVPGRMGLEGLNYADFRFRERDKRGHMHSDKGWTDPFFYQKELEEENAKTRDLTAQGVLRRVAGYRSLHNEAKFKVLGAIYGIEPRHLANESLIEENQRRQTEISVQRRRWIIRGSVLAGALSVSLLVLMLIQNERAKAEREREKAERALLLIGDAHDGASRLVADVLAELKPGMEQAGMAPTFAKAKRIVDEHLAQAERRGDDEASKQLRAVVLSSRGYLARRLQDYQAAEDYGKESLRIRQELLEKNPDNPFLRHGVALAHDMLGDVYAVRARRATGGADDAAEDWERAIREYEQGMGHAVALAEGAGATNQWRNDLAVSRFKLGDTLLEAGYPDKALAELQKGLPVADQLAAGAPDYVPWQMNLGMYCYEVGRVLLLTGDPAGSRTMLERAKGVFERLRKATDGADEIKEWSAKVDAALKDAE